MFVTSFANIFLPIVLYSPKHSSFEKDETLISPLEAFERMVGTRISSSMGESYFLKFVIEDEKIT